MASHGSRGRNLAAKKKRRAARTSRATGTPSPTLPQALYTVPIWQYPFAAHMLIQQMPELTHTDALVLMLSEPVRWQNADGRVSSIVPAEVMASTGESCEAFVAAIKALHELGSLSWDDARHLHIETFPENYPIES